MHVVNVVNVFAMPGGWYSAVNLQTEGTRKDVFHLVNYYGIKLIVYQHTGHSNELDTKACLSR